MEAPSMYRRDFETRRDAAKDEMLRLFRSLYGESGFDRLMTMLRSRWEERPRSLRELDRSRSENPRWYQGSSMVGMMLYVELFAGNFKAMQEKLGYLAELGITYLHILPVFTMPSDANDGGYAVSDFTSIDARFGTDEDFDAFANACHERGISVCLDFVLNHTSDEHAWAVGAREGDASCQARYFTFPDRTLPDAYERTVNEVFPVIAPGNFTHDARMDRWVLTTFNRYQWDLNYGNSDVFIDMADALLHMANRGVDIFRFDAIPYIWKEWGTSCRNLRQVHTLLRMFRLVLEIAAPSCIIKGEVVMAPQEVAPYFGTEEAPECHLLYNVSLMVELWNTLATRDARMLRSSLEALPTAIPEGACWVNYVRCHDDIGWGFDEKRARELHFDPFLHKQFLISFYEGSFPGSFSRGRLYEADPKTRDARNCGTCASLCGLEKATEEYDGYQTELALKRVVLLHGFLMAAPGIPVIYSGDEIAQLNNYGYANDTNRSMDSRNIHRQPFDWEIAQKRDDRGSPEGIIFSRVKHLILTRMQENLLGGGTRPKVLATDDDGTLCIALIDRTTEDPQGILLVVANFTEHQKRITIKLGRPSGRYRDLIQGKTVDPDNGPVTLGPYELLLLRGERQTWPAIIH